MVPAPKHPIAGGDHAPTSRRTGRDERIPERARVGVIHELRAERRGRPATRSRRRNFGDEWAGEHEEDRNPPVGYIRIDQTSSRRYDDTDSRGEMRSPVGYRPPQVETEVKSLNIILLHRFPWPHPELILLR